MTENGANVGSAQADERAGYLNVGRDQVFFVHHGCGTVARARVLLIGPFASERVHAYIGWVRWARYLASRGFDVFRFDHRGVGESTGIFDQQCFSTWLEDVEAVADFIDDQSDSKPLLIHGLRAGALIASRFFDNGKGDALLLWDPPKSARHLLRQYLRRKLVEDVVAGAGHGTVSRDELIRTLEQGEVIEVEGYRWSRLIWEDAQLFGEEPDQGRSDRPSKRIQLILDEQSRSVEAGRPWRIPIPSPQFWNGRRRVLVPDLSELFERSVTWLCEASESVGVQR